MSSESPRDRLPFEPRQTKKKIVKKSPATATADARQNQDKARQGSSQNETGIPEAVSKRMIRRMALFCGIPSALGMSSFIVSYYIVSQEIIELPTIAVLLVSLGFFGLGVLGLSYGIFSTSWDEERVGSLFGWEQFTLNLGRMIEAWKASRQEARSKS